MALPVLRRRRRSKRDQALDTVASLAKAIAEWQLAKDAARGARKGAKAAGAGYVAAKATPWKSLGILAVAGGAGALAAKKLRGGGDDGSQPYEAPTYTPPTSTGATSTPTSAASPPSVSGDSPAPSGGGIADATTPAAPQSGGTEGGSPVTPLDVMTGKGGTVPADPELDVEAPNESGPGHNPEPAPDKSA